MQDKLVQTLLEIVQIDSPSGEEDTIREYLIKRLKNAGIESISDKAGNLFARIEGVGEPVVLSCHMDTVEPGRGIKPVVDNGTIRSSGDTILGADNKVTLAAYLVLLENLPQNHCPIELVISVREETDGGINEFDFSQLKSKVGIAPDKSTPLGSVVTSSPGIIDLVITFIGEAAHSGRPHLGKNVLPPIVEVLSQMEYGQVDDKTTLNVGILNAGSAQNAVPGKAEVKLEIRGFDNDSLQNWYDNVSGLFIKAANDHDIKINIEKSDTFVSYVYTNESNGINRIVKSMNKVGIVPELERSFGGSDANTFSQYGIEVVNISDGSEGSHTIDENIKITEFSKLYTLLETYISIGG